MSLRLSPLTLAPLALALLCLAACGPSGGGDAKSAAKSNPAMPPADPARAAAINGYDKAGQPIDAVAAATMPEGSLPPLPADANAPRQPYGEPAKR